MNGFFGAVLVVWCIVVMVLFGFFLMASGGAPQQAAAAGSALAVTVIPYIILKCMYLEKMAQNLKRIADK
jgi:hypothetical protein